MTRTERATSLRAIVKDRSESKTGIDKHTPKNGAGTHNWGSLMDERDLEEQAAYDEEREIGKVEGQPLPSSCPQLFANESHISQPAPS